MRTLTQVADAVFGVETRKAPMPTWMGTNGPYRWEVIYMKHDEAPPCPAWYVQPKGWA